MEAGEEEEHLMLRTPDQVEAAVKILHPEAEEEGRSYSRQGQVEEGEGGSLGGLLRSCPWVEAATAAEEGGRP